MGKKLLIFIIVLAGIALAGIIYVQVSFMKNAYAQNETLFDYKVNDAIQSVVQNLDQMAIVEKIQVEMAKSKSNPKTKTKSKHKIYKMQDLNYTYDGDYDFNFDSIFQITINDSLIRKLSFSKDGEKTEELLVSKPGKNNVSVRTFSPKWKQRDSVWTISSQNVVIYSNKDKKHQYKSRISSSSFVRPNQNAIFYTNDSVYKNQDIFFENNFKFNPDSDFNFFINRDIVKKKEKDIKKVMKKMVAETDTKIIHERKRLNYLLIDSLLKSSLKNRDVPLNYEYTVIADTVKNKNEKVPSTMGFKFNSNFRKYEALLFPNDIIPKKDKIIVYFPDRQKHLVKSLSILLPSSLFFSFIIIVAFTISIMMVLRQKKLSDIKTDFINNMTHEFKTPIATISLAADTIINPKVISDGDKINHFIGIIKDENKRMNVQVERILQMAQLERKEIDLKLEKLDIHQLITKVLENIDIQIKQLNGKICTNFNAIDSDILVDEIHFTNVINNLLDNALKYTINPPEIIINTSQIEDGILLSFEDCGIGMTKEALSKIFEKFYRVSKGNIHNVKGFGLGLSYVKAIVESHGGRITVKSELNKGSRFFICLPQKTNGNGKSI
jgi:two-component system, OmpR family, phosphate regulon sensor histidine kinase PhoR